MRIEIPKNCPACDYPLELVNDQLYCRNTACSARLDKQIEHFTKTLGIKGLGAKSIEKLGLADITELYYLDREDLIESLGSEKVADKLLAEIEHSKTASLDKVLAAFGVPLIGNTAATKLCKVINNIDEINQESCKLAGLGDKATYNLVTWLDTVFVDMRQFLPFSFTTQSSTPANADAKTVCITGKLKSFKTKAEAYKFIEDAGYVIVESVTKKTDYLVDEEGKQSSKRKKAEELGITIISDLTTFI
jgi:DNA ligase (NAD+)